MLSERPDASAPYCDASEDGQQRESCTPGGRCSASHLEEADGRKMEKEGKRKEQREDALIATVTVTIVTTALPGPRAEPSPEHPPSSIPTTTWEIPLRR